MQAKGINAKKSPSLLGLKDSEEHIVLSPKLNQCSSRDFPRLIEASTGMVATSALLGQFG